MKKIAIFENEYQSVQGAFEVAKLIGFDNQLEIEVFPSSQKARFQTMKDYDAIFVDIDLSIQSKLDGFGVINEIQKIDKELINRIVILTGNGKIEEILQERGINKNGMQIIIKPTDFNAIIEAIRKI